MTQSENWLTTELIDKKIENLRNFKEKCFHLAEMLK